jgi:AGZA family xanthine/uracil permease-like MFS transporter
LWVRGDLDALFGLGTNTLLNLMVMSGLLLFVIEIPPAFVFGRILPAVGVMLALTNFALTYLAKRLADRTGRTDVTALPSGPSVPHMFFVVLLIMLPVKLTTGDPLAAWGVGLVWMLIEGGVLLVGAFVAPAVRRWLPRAAMLGTLAGVSIVFIMMQPLHRVFFELPVVGLLALGIMFGAYYARVRLPFNLPAALLAVSVATALAWTIGEMDAGALRGSVDNVGLYAPGFSLGAMFDNLDQFVPLLATAIPFGIYDVVEAMDNVESAHAAGDSYSVRSVLLMAGTASLLGTAVGSPFANAIYIGHPGWKAVGGRIGYAIGNGVLILVLCLTGSLAFLLALIPAPAILPILVYIGAMIGAQAFQAVPRRHAPAVVVAMTPHLAAWAAGLVSAAVTVAGTTADSLPSAELAANGVYYEQLVVFGSGAIVTGLVLGAVMVALIDHNFTMGVVVSIVAASLTYFGFMHSEELGAGRSPQLALGYLVLGALFVVFRLLGTTGSPDSELADGIQTTTSLPTNASAIPDHEGKAR